MIRTAGWYGKIPSLGDFASRRLPSTFIRTWDSWLQHSMAASRADLGDRWLDTYLTSPIWRFALMPETLNANAWAGLLMPSIDKVGRHFPLTLALELAADRHVDATTMILSAESWFSELEEVALSALSANFSADDLERGLTRLPFAPGNRFSRESDGAIESLAEWWLNPTAHSQFLQLPPTRSVLDAMTGAAMCVLGANAAGKSIWWSMAAASGATDVNLFTGLPDENHFAELLLGR